MKRAWISAILAVALATVAYGALPPQRALAAMTFYSQGNLPPDLTSSWNTARTGGAAPANSTSGDVFVIQNGRTRTASAIRT